MNAWFNVPYNKYGDTYFCLTHHLWMWRLSSADTYLCSKGCVITSMDIRTGAGKNAYWTTAKDLGNSGAGYSPNQSGILTSTTGTSTGTSAGTGNSFSTLVHNAWVQHHTVPMAFSAQIFSYGDLVSEPKPKLPVEKRDDPIHAWRYASKLKITNGVVLFDAVYPLNGCYAADDRAICNRNHSHHWAMIPVEECSCGFYASKPGAVLDRSCFDEGYDSDDDIPDVLLEVELYGRVIEAETGYRAQHQKILAVYSDAGYGVVPGFNIRPTSVAYDKMRKEVEMKIRFANGDKVLDIETADDMPLIVDDESFNLGWNSDESEVEEN